MKTLPVLFFLLLFSCNRKSMSKENLSGVYVRSFQSEYAVGTDTLQFSKTADDTYHIRKVSAYHRIQDGVMDSNIERHEAHWLGTFDKEHNAIQVLPSGKVLDVDVDKREILLGNAAYRRAANK